VVKHSVEKGDNVKKKKWWKKEAAPKIASLIPHDSKTERGREGF